MTVILYLLVISLALAAGGLAFFLWSLRSGQYDDLDGAANRILFDDDPKPAPTAPLIRPVSPGPAGPDTKVHAVSATRA